MLDHTCLIVHPWMPDGPTWTRRITDRDGRYLGQMRYDRALRVGWFAWLRKTRLHVYETEDDSHLMTLTSAWAMRRSWSVLDADDVHIGSLHLGRLVTSDGSTIGALEGNVQAGRIRDHVDELLASYRVRQDGAVEVTFMERAMENPFLRMLLLGSVLMQDAKPRGS